MFGPWLVIFGWLKQRMPKGWSALKPRLNFITLHCAYQREFCNTAPANRGQTCTSS
jgi:hypothetical protein